MLTAILGLLGGPVAKIIDKAVPDKDLATKIKAEIQSEALRQDSEIAVAGASIIKAEVQSDSAAAKNWRPHLMYLIMGLLVFNGVAVPLVEAFSEVDLPILEAWTAIPEQMWTLLQIGLGGYVVGRSVEKSVKVWKEK